MTAHADATLAAIVRELAQPLAAWDSPRIPEFWPPTVAPRGIGGETVKRHLEAAGYAKPRSARDGYWRLTPAGMAAVEAARGIRPVEQGATGMNRNPISSINEALLASRAAYHAETSNVVDLVPSLRAFGEMPLEGGDADPLIDVMNSLAHRAADEIERLRAAFPAYGQAGDTAAPWGAACEVGTHVAPSAPCAGSGQLSQHEAYAALRTALIGSGVLTLAECEAWARRIVSEAP